MFTMLILSIKPPLQTLFSKDTLLPIVYWVNFRPIASFLSSGHWTFAVLCYVLVVTYMTGNVLSKMSTVQCIRVNDYCIKNNCFELGDKLKLISLIKTVVASSNYKSWWYVGEVTSSYDLLRLSFDRKLTTIWFAFHKTSTASNKILVVLYYIALIIIQRFSTITKDMFCHFYFYLCYIIITSHELYTGKRCRS